MIRGCHDAIGNDIVNKIRSCRTQKTEIIYLYRCWPESTNAQPVSPGVANEVNQDVYPIFIYESGGISVTYLRYIKKTVASALYLLPILTSVISTIRVTVNLENVPIVGAEKSECLVGHRMIAQIVGEIADGDSLPGMVSAIKGEVDA